MMNEYGKSDSLIVPGKSPNNVSKETAEVMEGRGLAKGNPPKRTASRTQSRTNAPSALERVRQAAKKDTTHPYPLQRFGVMTQGRSPVR
jgi:RNA-directed DNA polymerase